MIFAAAGESHVRQQHEIEAEMTPEDLVALFKAEKDSLLDMYVSAES
jgi:hypothetical protein